MPDKKEARDLKFDLEFNLETSNTGYSNHVTVLHIKKEIQLNLNTDSPKRKIVGQLEDIVEDTLQEAYRTLQDSNKLTDGAIAKEDKEKESGF